MHFGVTVQSVEPAREDDLPENGTTSTSIPGPSSHTLRPTVRLKTGEILHADVIIGADGQRSIVRPVVTDEDEGPKVTPIGITMYTGCVPMTEVRKYPPLKQLTDVGWLSWVGDGRVVLGAFTISYNDPCMQHAACLVSPLFIFADSFLRYSRLSDSETFNTVQGWQ